MSITIKTGICCVCQSRIPINKSSLPREEELAHYDNDEFFVDMQYGDCINYVMIDHDFFGEKCSGSGQIPQFLVA